ncbi:hypothetical protein [Acuticoccus sp.]|uniref:hypothetical protein n=1 Tax=Acuticoccus sp. TaxID=1904378 RepID=UPI003B517AE7
MAKRVRVLAVASGGGHWVQLFRMRKSWTGCAVTYATTTPDFRDEVIADARERGEAEPQYRVVVEANRWQKLRLLRSLLQIALVVVRARPDVVVSTGAAPGYFALRIARLLGIRTIWVDSIANASELSLSGQRIGRHADVWLTQWEDLARANGPQYWGAVV